jgi:DNA-directed RNA polymerase subunit A'
MNLHIPQNEEARAEAEILLEVETQVISPRYGLSIIGCNQDAVSGNYVLTKYLDFPRNEAVDLLASIGITDFSKLPKKEIISGKEVFSVLLPQDFNFEGHAKSYKPGSENPDDFVKIENGILKSGVLDSANIGGGSGLLLRNLHKQYGQERALKMLGLFFRLGVQTLLKYGFSSSLSDIDLTENAAEQVEQIIVLAEKEVDKLIKKYNQKTLVALPGRGLRETLELQILEVLNKARNDAGKLVFDTADVMSHTYMMVDSGARGNEIQLAQMAACVGQQAFRGSRINQGFEERTLSCFKKNDLSPKAHGFVRGGYKEGLKPHEFFFMNMTGRDSLMDTALRTPKSGYLYRRLANAMQDLKVEYDFTVRDADHKIIQFMYGEDGIDVSKSEGGSINIKKIIDAVIKG